MDGLQDVEKDRIRLRLAHAAKCHTHFIPLPSLYLYRDKEDRGLGRSPAVVRGPRREPESNEERLEVALLAVGERLPVNLHHLRRRLHAIDTGEEAYERDEFPGE